MTDNPLSSGNNNKRKNFFIKTRPDRVVAILKQQQQQQQQQQQSQPQEKIHVPEEVQEEPDDIIVIDDEPTQTPATTAPSVKKTKQQYDELDGIDLDPELRAIMDRVTANRNTTQTTPGPFCDIKVFVHLSTSDKPDHTITLPAVDCSLPLKHVIDQTVTRLRLSAKRPYRLVLPVDKAAPLFTSASITSVLDDATCPRSIDLIVADAHLNMQDGDKQRRYGAASIGDDDDDNDNGKSITVKVRFSPTRTDTVTVTVDDPLVAQLQLVSPAAVYMFDGERVSGVATCLSMALEDGDMIDAR